MHVIIMEVHAIHRFGASISFDNVTNIFMNRIGLRLVRIAGRICWRLSSIFRASAVFRVHVSTLFAVS